MAKLLLIDDDAELGELLARYLAGHGHLLEHCGDGVTGLEKVVRGGFDLVLLDLMMPIVDGFEVLRRLRQDSGLPVIMLTARGEAVDRVVGLELGADDYLAKPFDPRELAARIRAVLRRSKTAPGDAELLVVGDLELAPASGKLRLAGTQIHLTAAELAILELMMCRAGELVSRDELSRAALDRRAAAWDRALDSHLSNLRSKLGRLEDGSRRIATVRGRGYRLLVPESH